MQIEKGALATDFVKIQDDGDQMMPSIENSAEEHLGGRLRGARTLV